MNILPVNFIKKTNNASQLIAQSYHTELKLRPQLSQDTVSFTGVEKEVGKAAQKITTTMGDVFIDTYEKNYELYKALGMRLLDTLEAVSIQFKDAGVSLMPRAVAEKYLVKSPRSFISKFIRSASVPKDRIRATLYVNDPYDLNLINNILESIGSRGYEIDTDAVRIGGKSIKKKDFSIRLSGITERNLMSLPEDLKIYDKPVASGYEDIQFRVIDKFATGKKRQTPLEVIIHFGENYQKAKHIESSDIYGPIIRVLKDELLLPKVKDVAPNSPIKKIEDNIDIITQKLHSKISRPLFLNAKNMDVDGVSLDLDVGLTDYDAAIVQNLTRDIAKQVKKLYEGERLKLKSGKLDDEIIKIIRESGAFGDVKNNEITLDMIIERQGELLNHIDELEKDQLTVCNEVRKAVDKVVKDFVIKS